MKTASILVALSAFLSNPAVHADSFGMGPNQFTMDFVDIGYAGNETRLCPIHSAFKCAKRDQVPIGKK